jgi:hypothetical protein
MGMCQRLYELGDVYIMIAPLSYWSASVAQPGILELFRLRISKILVVPTCFVKLAQDVALVPFKTSMNIFGWRPLWAGRLPGIALGASAGGSGMGTSNSLPSYQSLKVTLGLTSHSTLGDSSSSHWLARPHSNLIRSGSSKYGSSCPPSTPASVSPSESPATSASSPVISSYSTSYLVTEASSLPCGRMKRAVCGPASTLVDRMDLSSWCSRTGEISMLEV